MLPGIEMGSGGGAGVVELFSHRESRLRRCRLDLVHLLGELTDGGIIDCVERRKT
jgi:hypothetical protein